MSSITPEEIPAVALEFCKPPRWAQMFTLDKNQIPIGRTLNATLMPDMSVEIVSEREFARGNQVRRNPGVTFMWQEPPEGGKGIPKIMFARGTGEVLTGDYVTNWYDGFVKERGNQFGVERDQAADKWEIIRVTIKQIRAEGFPGADGVYTRESTRYGVTLNL